MIAAPLVSSHLKVPLDHYVLLVYVTLRRLNGVGRMERIERDRQGCV